jgi:hypothetical protein
MAEDTSLDEFLGGEDAGSAESTDEESVDTEPADEDTSEPTGSDDPGGIEPARTTYAWSGDGVACRACGEVVQCRWDQDGALVCSACKEW